MVGAFKQVTVVKQERIKALIEEGLSNSVIAERLGIASNQVHYWRTKFELLNKNKSHQWDKPESDEYLDGIMKGGK